MLRFTISPMGIGLKYSPLDYLYRWLHRRKVNINKGTCTRFEYLCTSGTPQKKRIGHAQPLYYVGFVDQFGLNNINACMFSLGRLPSLHYYTEDKYHTRSRFPLPRPVWLTDAKLDAI